MRALLLILVVGLTSIHAQADISDSVIAISKLKVEALSTLNATPYRVKEHQSIKNYFLGVMDFAIEAKDNSKTNRRLNNYLASGDMAKFCAEIFIDSTDWNQIKQNCTRNRFFLCSEEVNEFPAFKKTLSEALSTRNQETFKNTPACQ